MAPSRTSVVQAVRPIRCHRDLLAWQRAMDLVEACYRLTARLPRDERFGLSSQLRRAAVSVAANIAEGHGRYRTGEVLWSLSVARGSLMEVDALLRITERLGLVERTAIEPVLELVAEIGRMLSGLRRALRHRCPARPASGPVAHPSPPTPDP